VNGFNEHLTAALDETARDVVAEAMTDLARDLGYWRRLPRLRWAVDVFAPLVEAGIQGVAGTEYAVHQVPGVVRRWADALGLDEVPEPRPGLIEFAGTVDGRPVRVLGVVGLAAWAGDVQAGSGCEGVSE
jgi:hypothetical protein